MQRTAMNLATQQNCEQLTKGMLYLGRFWTAQAVMVHESETSVLLLTEDAKQKSSADGKHRVAVKLMKNEKEWRREQDMRKMCLPIDKHVVRILESCVDKKAMQSTF